MPSERRPLTDGPVQPGDTACLFVTRTGGSVLLSIYSAKEGWEMEHLKLLAWIEYDAAKTKRLIAGLQRIVDEIERDAE